MYQHTKFESELQPFTPGSDTGTIDAIRVDIARESAEQAKDKDAVEGHEDQINCLVNRITERAELLKRLRAVLTEEGKAE